VLFLNGGQKRTNRIQPRWVRHGPFLYVHQYPNPGDLEQRTARGLLVARHFDAPVPDVRRIISITRARFKFEKLPNPKLNTDAAAN
jgi:hypothetical protein